MNINIIEDNKILSICRNIYDIFNDKYSNSYWQLTKLLPLLNKLKPYITNIMYDNNYRMLLNMLLLSYQNILLDKKTYEIIPNELHIEYISHETEIILLHTDFINFYKFINEVYKNYIIDDELEDTNIIYCDIIDNFEDIKTFILHYQFPNFEKYISEKYISEDLKNIILNFHFEYFNNSFNDLIFFIINNVYNLNCYENYILLNFIAMILNIINNLIYLKYEYFYNSSCRNVFNDYIDIKKSRKPSIKPYKVLYEINKKLSLNK